MNSNALSMTIELKDKLSKQIQEAKNNTEKLAEAVEKLNIDIRKIDASTIQKNLAKNFKDAENAMYKLVEAKEKIDKVLSRNAFMKSEGFAGIDDSSLRSLSSNIDKIIDKIVNVGVEANLSKSAVRDLMASLSTDIVLKSSKSSVSSADKELNNQIKERGRLQKEAAKEAAAAEKEAESAALRNAKNQERVKNAISRIATARAELTAASSRGNQEEVAHAQLLIKLLDNLSSRLNSMKSKFLGEKGILDGILGSGYDGLMRNVSSSIRNIGKIDSSIVQSPVKLLAEQDTSSIQRQIDLVGALHTQIRRLYEELGRAANNSNRIMPTNWQEMKARGLYTKGSPYQEQMEFLKKLRAYGGDMASQKAVVEENIQKLQSLLNVYRESGINVQGYQKHLDALYATLVKFEALKTTDLSAKLGLGHIAGYTGPQKALSDEAWASAKKEAEIREVAIKAAERHRRKLEEITAAFDRHEKAQARDAAQKERSAQASRKVAMASAETSRNLNKEAGEVVKLRLEMLKTQAVQLQGLIKNGKGYFDDSQLIAYREALRKVVQEITTLKGVMENMSSFSGRKGQGLMSFGSGTNYSPLISHGQQALDTARAVGVLTDSERRYIETLTQASSALSKHGMLLNDLQMMATQYLSLWGARTFLNNIIETGGLLEQQRLSIGAILGSIDKADVIFDKIKNLAIKSPFGVVELDKMSKQLTAYGFEYEELFDWTKRLADISAATGTEVSRLALALGHVRSEGALSGYTLRQFAMGNIPLLQKLSENLGISTKEVREQTRKKNISYDDVKKVLEDLTNEGGMFYEAQEVMSQALNAKFKNLRDAFDIMYGEIAESGVGDLLKSIAVSLTEGAKDWRRFGTDILWVAGAFGVAKAATLAYTSGMAVLTKKMGILAFNTRVYTSEQLRSMALQGSITRGQLLEAVATGRLSAEKARLAGETLGLSAAQLQQVATSRRVDAALLGNALSTSKYNIAQLRMLATMRAQIGVGGAFGVFLSRLAIGFQGVGVAVRAAGMAMRSFLPFLAIGAVVDLFSRASNQKTSAKEMAETSASSMLSAFEDIKSMYETLQKKGTDDKAKSVSSMKDILQESGLYHTVKKEVESTQDVGEQYDILYAKVKNLTEGYDGLKYTIESIMSKAYNIGGGWFSDNMQKDIEQFGSARIDVRVAQSSADKFSEIYLKEIRKNLKKNGLWDEKTMKDLKWDELLEKVQYKNQFWTYLRKTGTIFDSEDRRQDIEDYNRASEALKNYTDALRKLESAEDEVMSQMPEFSEMVKDAAGQYSIAMGIDPKNMENWGKEDFDVYAKGFNNALSQLKVDEETKKKIKDEIIASFPQSVKTNIEASFNGEEEEKKLAEWQEDIQTYFNDNKINVRVSADDSLQSIEKKLQDERKKMQEKMDSSGGILLKVLPSLDLGTLEKGIESAIKKFPFLKNILKRAKDDYKEGKESVEKIKKVEETYGLKTEDDKKNKKSGGSKVDKELNDWKKRISLLEKYRQKLDELSKYMSRSDAEKKLREGGNFASLWNFGDPNDFAGYLRGAIAKLGKKGERGNYANELMAKIEDDLLREFTKNADDAVSELRKLLDVMRENYDVYKKWVEMTGDEALAASIAGVARNSSLADLLKSKYDELGGIGSMSADDFFALSESDAKKRGGDKSEYFALWQEWDKNEKKIRSERLKTYEEAYKSAKSYEDRITDINRQLEREIANLDAIQDISDSERARLKENLRNNAGKKIADETWKQFKEESDYGRVFGDLNNMSTTTLEAMRDELLKYAPSVSESVEATKALYEALDKIDKLLLERNPFTALANAMNVQAGIKKFLEDFADADLDTIINLDAKSAKRYGLGDGSRGWSGTKSAAIDALERSSNEASKALGGIANKFKDVQKVLQPVIDLFAQLGNTTLSDFFNTGSNVIGSAVSVFEGINGIKGMFKPESGIASFLGSAAPYAAAAGAAVSLISSIVAMHDASLQREIEASQARQKEMQNLSKNLETALSRTLGGVYSTKASGAMLASLRKEIMATSIFDKAFGGGYKTYISKETKDAVKEAEKTKTYYDAAYASLLAQRDELQHQMNLEDDKKDSDSGKIADYKQQLVEMEDQIEHFAEDMAKALYDIDVKSWASELGDALFEAWQKGEDGAEAFKKKASKIIANVAKKIAVTKLIETAMKPVLDVITSEMEATDGKLNEQSIAKISSQMAVVGQTLPGAFNSLMDALDEGLKKGGLDSMKEDAKKEGSISNTIKGITEDTAGLLASYINAIRADVSLNRVSLADIQMSVAMLREMPAIAEAQLRQLEQIVANTGATAVNTAAIREIYDLLHGNTLGQNYLRVK